MLACKRSIAVIRCVLWSALLAHFCHHFSQSPANHPWLMATSAPAPLPPHCTSACIVQYRSITLSDVNTISPFPPSPPIPLLPPLPCPLQKISAPLCSKAMAATWSSLPWGDTRQRQCSTLDCRHSATWPSQVRRGGTYYLALCQFAVHYEVHPSHCPCSQLEYLSCLLLPCRGQPQRAVRCGCGWRRDGSLWVLSSQRVGGLHWCTSLPEHQWHWWGGESKYTHTYRHIHMRARTHTHTHTHTHKHLRTHKHTYVHTHTSMYI